jgi:hypothetical protein
MGFVAALLLMYMGEEEAFWLFVQLMKNYNMSYIYEPGLPQLQVYMYQFEALFKATNPVLFAHFDKCGVPVSMYASQWFMTNFLYSLPFETALRVRKEHILRLIRLIINNSHPHSPNTLDLGLLFV